MSIACGGDGDERAGAEEIPRGGDVVAGLVPEIGKAQQREMRKNDRNEKDGIEQGQRWGRPRGACGRVVKCMSVGHWISEQVRRAV
jgi:hypothetical protein